MSLAKNYSWNTSTRKRGALRVAPPADVCVIYTRLSRDKTGEGIGVERQERLCRELADRKGWTVAGVHSDNSTSGYSVRLDTRPGWLEVRRAVEAGEVGRVIVHHTDRVSRRMSDTADVLEWLETYGVTVEAVDGVGWSPESPDQEFTAHVLGAQAQMYSRLIGRKVKRAHMARADQGRAHGGPRPFGYRRPRPGEPESPSLIVEPAEADVVRDMARRYLSGESLTSIAAHLEDSGISTATGGRWQTSQVWRTMSHPRVAGLHAYKGEIVGEADWTPLLDRDDWERLNARHRAMRGNRTSGRSRVALLAGHIRCAECGQRMSTGYSGERPSKARPDGRQVRMYRCNRQNSRDSCGSCAVRAEPVEDDVVRQVLATLARTNLASAHVRQSVTDSRDLVDQIARDEAELDSFAAKVARGDMTAREWEVMRPPVADRIAEARGKLVALESESDLPDGVWSGVTPETWETYTLAERRAVVGVLIAAVHVSKGERGKPWNGSRLRIEWRLG